MSSKPTSRLNLIQQAMADLEAMGLIEKQRDKHGNVVTRFQRGKHRVVYVLTELGKASQNSPSFEIH
jgi:hypothetical protein